ncbi:desmoglein-2-like [Parambassis ranga]|uniref:Desmoglein-2-like n=1 Tax=Parambassis ranga TaxID=210632 RepID=A0A6P7K0Y9_9TELE|nr:desmoglein-2-like [Parambassis ranga]
MAPPPGCSLFAVLTFAVTLIVPVWAEWITVPRHLKENRDYTGLEYIAKIRSDKDTTTKIVYSLMGPGVDQPPYHIFGVDPNNGYVKIYSILDREQIPFYNLKGRATYADGSLAERDIDLNITVQDVNDNPPIIKVQQVGFVNESSAAGTVVMKIIATDADKENTPHSKIFYKIVESTAGMFHINHQTGEVIVRQSNLDRETKDTYKLTIEASDMDGQSGGLRGTGEIEIKILDINDNIPTLEKESYTGSVEENTVNVEVLRIKAIDMDLIHTDNWLAEYEIISGNEGGYFSITTDAKTNEGIIMINKAIDYEQLKELNLDVMVRNKAAYNFGSSSATGATGGRPYRVKINVLNQREGPHFKPSVKVVKVSEDHSSVSINKVIATYAAIDSDTLQTATNVRYVKLRDIDNWLIIDGQTADIRLNKLPDRESKFLINGTYYAEIICITNDSPSKTATGTIAIQVEDFNDHCPRLTAKTQTMCFEQNVIYVTAVDEDEFPNSVPFDFTVIEESSKGKWTVEPLNATTAILHDHAHLWPGTYKVQVEIKDQQGKFCADAQIIDVIVCTCQENTKTCMPRSAKTSSFGAPGILLLLLGLLLLLLIPLLMLFCLCGGPVGLADFKAIPFDTKQQLISYHTEGQGEDKEIPLLHVPVEVDAGTVNAKNINTFEGKGFLGGLRGAGGAGMISSTVNTLTAENMHLYNQYKYSSGQEEMDFRGTGMMRGQDFGFSRYDGSAFDGMALSDHFLEEYYSSKSDHAAQQSQQKDGFLVYDYEGNESLAGSVGCCSLLDNEDDLAFLNDLGPKFKTLAEICKGSTLVTESVDTGVSIPPIRPVSPVQPSTSTHTHVHTHSETIRDRDRINLNTLHSSNVASGSSTIIQEEQITKRVPATLPQMQVQDKIVIPSQTLLIQQPTMYYAATPMYVVESKPQVMLVAGAPQQAVGQVGQVGLSQGLVQVSGLQGSQGVVLVDRQEGVSRASGQASKGRSQGTVSRSRQVLVVESESSGGEQGAHRSQTGQTSTEQGFDARGHGMQMKAQSFSISSRGSTGSNENFTLTAPPMAQGSQRVVVEQKKVSVTERNIESSTRA